MDFDIGEFIRKHYKILIPIVILVFIIMGLLIFRAYLDAIPESGRAEILNLNHRKFETIEELLEYYECEYISVDLVRGNTYLYEINSKLKLPPYTGVTSNEDFYYSLINDIAIFYNYVSFSIVDESKELKVQVLCMGGEIEKITINGIEDYFNKHNEELALREYKEYKNTEFSIDSPILNELINNNWSKDVNFGSRESRFNNYEIYFDEGIEVRIIQGRVYNIIFKSNYNGPVISGLTPQNEKSNIISELGIPTFDSDNPAVFGYKNNEIYVFFYNNEISIYRNEKLSNTEMNDFAEFLDKFYREEIDYTDFMDELTERWKDYAKYDYNASSVYISYPLKGFEIKVNYDNTRGFIFYNNFALSKEKIEHFLDNNDFMAFLQLDCVYEAEKNRVNEKISQNEKIEKISNNFYDSNAYDVLLEKDSDGNILKVSFISTDGSTPNRELNDSISTFAWINDNYFVFSKQGNGLYGYDLNSGYVSTLVLGNHNYNITGSDIGSIICDNEEINIDM